MIYFRQIAEPNQNAFTLLAPEGWLTSGGAFFIDPTQAGGAANSTDTKIDFTVKSDARGTALLHWYPDLYRIDLRYMPAAPYLAGQETYQGMPISPVLSPFDFADRILFRQQRPAASGIQVIERTNLPELAEQYRQSTGLSQQMPFRYSAGALIVEYLEQGTRFRELFFTIIEDLGEMGAGMWSNRYAFSCRAPAGQFEQMAPVFRVISGSIRLNPQWVQAELRNRAQREGTLLQVNQHIHELSAQIMEGHNRTRSDINYNVYKTLTGQEEFVNPHTGKIELDTDAWKYRWQKPNGELIFTNDPNYDPTRDPRLQHNSEFQLCKVHPR